MQLSLLFLVLKMDTKLLWWWWWDEDDDEDCQCEVSHTFAFNNGEDWSASTTRISVILSNNKNTADIVCGF